MAPGLAASRTKKEFLVALNLLEGQEYSERMFKKMLVRLSLAPLP